MFAGLLWKKKRDRSECCRMGRSASPCCSYVAAAGLLPLCSPVQCWAGTCSLSAPVPASSGAGRVLAVLTLGPCLTVLVDSSLQPLTAPPPISPTVTLLKGFKQKIKSPVQAILLFSSPVLFSRRAKCPTFVAPANLKLKMIVRLKHADAYRRACPL